LSLLYYEGKHYAKDYGEMKERSPFVTKLLPSFEEGGEIDKNLLTT
jgi:hypothetical protein